MLQQWLSVSTKSTKEIENGIGREEVNEQIQAAVLKCTTLLY